MEHQKHYAQLIASELKIDEKDVIVREHLFHPYVTAYTTAGEYKVVFKMDWQDKGTYIDSIIKIGGHYNERN